MCIILRISIKTNPKILCALGGVYFRVITLDSVKKCVEKLGYWLEQYCDN